MSIKVTMTAELEDGRELTATADQRDFAAAEALELPDGRHLWVRSITWAALTRTRQYDKPWATFNGTECVEARDARVEEPAGDDEGLDPGREAPTDAA